MSALKTSERAGFSVPDALQAICATGKGRCWFCDVRLPRLQQALRTGWDVQRIEGARVATIILICPTCQLKADTLKSSDHTLVARA